MAASSSLERTSADLQMVRHVVHKLGETVDSFQVHSYSIFNFVDQWRNLQSSFTEVHNSLECRVKELESKEREIAACANKLHSFRDDVELKRKTVEDGERCLSEKIKQVEARQNEVKKWMEVIGLQKREISERNKAVEAKERELVAGLERLKRVDEDEVRVRKAELEVLECRKAVELREGVVDERCKAVELRENVVDERFEELKLREGKVKEREEELNSREGKVKECEEELEVWEGNVKEREEAVEVERKELDEKKRVMGAKETRLIKDQQALELRERDLDDVYRFLELRESEIEETLKGVNSKEKELILREEEMELHHEVLKSIEKDTSGRVNELKVKEDDLKNRCRALEEKMMEFNERFASLVAKEEEVDKGSRDVEMIETQVKAQLAVVEAREVILKEHWEMLELKGKDVDERAKVMGLKEKEVEELQRILKLNEEQLNADIKGWELKQKQIDERCKEMDMKEIVISDRYKEMETKEKQLTRRKKAMDLREKQFEDLRKGLELKEMELKEPPLGLGSKDNQSKELSREVESKEMQLDDPSQARESKQDNELSKMQDCKGKPVVETSKTVESKGKQINDLSQGLQFEKKQRDEHVTCDYDKVSEFKDKDIQTDDLAVEQTNGCAHKLELKGKQMSDGALNLKPNQSMNQQNISVSKEYQKGDNSIDKEIAEFHKLVESKEDQKGDTPKDKQILVESKENQDNDIAETSDVGQKRICESDLVVDSNEHESGASLLRAMDGKTLMLYLNQIIFRKKHVIIKEEIVEVLKSTSDPAKLVLDAVEGFFAPHLSKGGVTFKPNVVRTSCLLLLEQLMDIKPVIDRALKKEATKVAVKWKVKMKPQGENEVVIVTFLMLYIIYKLESLFQKVELRRLFGMVEKHRLAPRLRKGLGLLNRPRESSNLDGDIKEPIQSESVPVANAIDSSPAKIPVDILSLCRSMNEHGVRSYLIDHVKELKSLSDKILDALRYATDPAKLVLDICQISATDPDKNRAEVSNTACIFLLEQLMKLSPSISNEVTEEAKLFAGILKASLKGRSVPVDHYKFLQFLASYKLTSYYPQDELLSYFEVLYHGAEVYRPDDNVHLCFALGITKKIPGIIKALINQKNLLLAVKYICVFKLLVTFPPVPLLEAHWEAVKKEVDQKCKEGTFQAKVAAENLESMTLKSIITCIYEFKLESKLAPDRFIARIKELEKEKERRKDVTCAEKRRSNVETSSQPWKRPRVTLPSGVAPDYWPQCPPGPLPGPPPGPLPGPPPGPPPERLPGPPPGPPPERLPGPPPGPLPGPPPERLPGPPPGPLPGPPPERLPGPPPRSRSFGSPEYGRPMFNEPDPHSTSFSAGYGVLSPPYHFIPDGRCPPVTAPIITHGVNDQVWTPSNHQRY